jgi:hypothetical protein
MGLIARFLLAPIGSLVAAAYAARYVWQRTENSSVGGALTVGAIAFVVGFFGPMIWAPDANQGPLLGLFITGPLGFLLGGAGGLVYGLVRRQGPR